MGRTPDESHPEGARLTHDGRRESPPSTRGLGGRPRGFGSRGVLQGFLLPPLQAQVPAGGDGHATPALGENALSIDRDEISGPQLAEGVPHVLAHLASGTFGPGVAESRASEPVVVADGVPVDGAEGFAPVLGEIDSCHDFGEGVGLLGSGTTKTGPPARARATGGLRKALRIRGLWTLVRSAQRQSCERIG